MLYFLHTQEFIASLWIVAGRCRRAAQLIEEFNGKSIDEIRAVARANGWRLEEL